MSTSSPHATEQSPPSVSDETLEQHVFLDRLTELNRQIMYSTAAAPIAWLLVGYVMSKVVPLNRVLFWLALMLLAEGCCFLMTLSFKRSNPQIHDAGRWSRLHGLFAVTSGIAWGSSTWLMWPLGNLEYQELLLLVLSGVSAVGVISNATMRRATFGLVVPIWVMALTRLWSEGTPILLVLAALVVVFAIMILVSGEQMTRTITTSIRLRYENLNLVSELRSAIQTAEGANRAKSTFLAAASHDLRQPVHALGLIFRTLAHFGRAKEVDRAAIIDGVEHGQRALSGLNALLNSLLDISRIDAGATTFLRQAVSLSTLFNDLELEFSPRATEKKLSLRFRPSAQFALSDPVALRRILANLVDNAVRYTSRGGVFIGVRKRDGKLLLQVCDTGVGIPEDQRATVFEDFYQLNNTERNREQGLGLGLAIVRRLCAALDHGIDVRSRVDQGSVFTVAVARAETVPSTVDVRHLRDDEPNPVVERNVKPLVLIIDDDADVLSATSVLLQACGYEVVTARSDVDLPDFMTLSHCDAIICDFRLPGVRNGAELVTAIGALTGRAIPALLITGDTAPERIQEAGTSGLSVLHKPIAPEALERELHRLLSSGREPVA